MTWITGLCLLGSIKPSEGSWSMKLQGNGPKPHSLTPNALDANSASANGSRMLRTVCIPD